MFLEIFVFFILFAIFIMHRIKINFFLIFCFTFKNFFQKSLNDSGRDNLEKEFQSLLTRNSRQVPSVTIQDILSTMVENAGKIIILFRHKAVISRKMPFKMNFSNP